MDVVLMTVGCNLFAVWTLFRAIFIATTSIIPQYLRPIAGLTPCRCTRHALPLSLLPLLLLRPIPGLTPCLRTCRALPLPLLLLLLLPTTPPIILPYPLPAGKSTVVHLCSEVLFNSIQSIASQTDIDLTLDQGSASIVSIINN
jgi:hypothetical protein